MTIETLYTTILNTVAPTYSNYSNLPAAGNYIVFSQTYTPVRTKTPGAQLLEVDITISIYATKLSDANTLASAVEAAINTTSATEQRAAFLQDQNTEYDPETKRTIKTITFKTYVKI